MLNPCNCMAIVKMVTSFCLVSFVKKEFLSLTKRKDTESHMTFCCLFQSILTKDALVLFISVSIVKMVTGVFH